MKTFNCLILFALLVAVCASAQQMVDPGGLYYETPPTRYEGQGVAGTVTPAWLVDNAGWSYASPERIAEEEDAQAAAQAEAEALRGPAPEVFVPMLDDTGAAVGTARLVVLAGSLAVVASTNSASPQVVWVEQRGQILAQISRVAESRASAAAARLAIKQAVLEGDVPEADLDAIVELWPEWATATAYTVDEILRYGGSLYKVVQAHTSQPDWTPDAVPALFAAISPPGIIAAWVQPTGAHDTYAAGDRVTHKDSVWESTVANNSWEPGVYGWTEIGD